ncbi:hypothetical protein C0214_19605 [Methylobacterium sp. DM1]|nr:hypothetical protein C0214_19605 [Methylobacterium sp. DM1]
MLPVHEHAGDFLADQFERSVARAVVATFSGLDCVLLQPGQNPLPVERKRLSGLLCRLTGHFSALDLDLGDAL